MNNSTEKQYSPRSPQPELSLVIPCYNEQDVIHNTVLHLVETFQAKKVNLELVLVDNGSGDQTGEIIDGMIKEGFPIVKQRVDINEGYGHGVLFGLKAARGRLVGFICADEQVEAHDVFRVYDIAAHARKPMLVKVRRRFRMDGLIRKTISVTYNILTTLLFFGLGSIDINGNPKIMPREYLERMNLHSKDWFLDAEVMIKAKRLGLPIYEFNVIAQMREGGVSHVHSSTCWEFVVNLMKYRFSIGRGLEVTSSDSASQQTFPEQG
jgi:glycosyltransferase involved in cell wall biosynthesis